MNKSIISAVVLIAAVSVVNAVLAKRPITKIIIGAYLFLLVLSLVDALGGGTLADALAWLAVLVVVLDAMPWGVLMKMLGNTPTTSSSQVGGQGVIA